ncbi:unnamed protein product [Owenia fusiformis]|uniref:Regulator of microtubule dynamics protein 2 n=1 Tax=Owenia fusiformis TaxID=6347 RepID=A0A8J1Y5U4_OWEFU|nr:unnamed protein product [Owenia fusiformis]
MPHFRDHVPILAAVGAGLVVGTSITVIYYKLSRNVSRQLSELTESVNRLQVQLSELQEHISICGSMVGSLPATPMRSPGSTSNHEAFLLSSPPKPKVVRQLSSDDDDDKFEDTFETEEMLLGKQAKIKADSNIYKQIDKQLESNDTDKAKAYQTLCDMRDQHQQDTEFLWRLAKSTYQMSQIEGANGNKERQKELVYEGKNIAFNALDIKEDDANIQKWCAITLGKVGDYESMQDKILNGFKFKEHIERGIEIDPLDPSLHYLLGRWCYGVFELSWLERKLAATLFATPPTSTSEEALKHFLQAHKLAPTQWKENMLFIAKCYIQQSQYSEAMEWLNKAAVIQAKTVDDKAAHIEIENLQYKYSYYAR